MSERVPVRLLVHFQTASRPLVQVTQGLRDGTRVTGAGTHAIDTSHPAREFDLLDPATGQPTGERITIARALAIFYSLAKR